MTKQRAIKLVCGKKGNSKQLAKALKISPAAVSKWNNDKIPRLRELEIKEMVRKAKG